jgi:prepilin peptidase CpaA
MELVLAVACLAAAWTDFRTRRIPNAITYPTIVAGLVLNGAGDLSSGVRELLGTVGWEGSVGGFLACGGLMLVCFVLFSVGGGDVKLLAAGGTCLGVERGLEVLLWTFVLGAVAGLASVVWRVGAVRLAGVAGRMLLGLLRMRGRVAFGDVGFTESEREMLRPPLFLAPMTLAAVGIVVSGWGR